jgi:hypothetical protein
MKAAEAFSEVRGAGAPRLAPVTFNNLEHGRERGAGPLDRRDLRKALGSVFFRRALSLGSNDHKSAWQIFLL